MMPNSASAILGFNAGGDSKYLRNAGTYLPEYKSVYIPGQSNCNHHTENANFHKQSNYIFSCKSKYMLATLTAQFYMSHLRIRFYV